MKNVKRMDETVVMRGTHGDKYDITKNKRSIAGKLEDLIGRMDKMAFPDLKSEVEHILKDEDTHASKATRKKWLDIVAKTFDKNRLMQSISNLYLKAANLGVNEGLDQLDVNEIFEKDGMHKEKVSRRKYFVGNKKLKNVELFEGFNVSEGDRGGNFASDLENVWSELNIMHLLMDEGYLEKNGTLMGSVTYKDANDFLWREHNIRDFFDSDQSVENWVLDTMEHVREFGNKY
jgi:hypothetical protein